MNERHEARHWDIWPCTGIDQVKNNYPVYIRCCQECREYFETQAQYTWLCSLPCWGTMMCRKYKIVEKGVKDVG